VPDGTIEIITGRERRRRWSVAEKLRIVAESQEAGARICDVAARYDVYPSLLHGWRRLVREGRLVPEAALNFVPVRLASSPDDAPASESSSASSTDREMVTIEVVLPSGGRILIRRDTPVPMLRAVIAALRG
jgi:transposase